MNTGGFAHVYLASLVSPAQVDGFPPSQNRFVLKRMAVPDKAGLVEVRREVDVMKQLRPHKHIVYFIEASASSIPESQAYEIFILMEWCPGGGIIDLLNSRLQNRLTESEILKIFSDTVAAVAHMHSQTPILIHRDLKVHTTYIYIYIHFL
jgi:AP2-associated kinase